MARITAEINKNSAPISALETKIAELSKTVEGLTPRGWRKAIRSLRELGPLAAIIAVFVALLGITLGSIYQSFGHIQLHPMVPFRPQTRALTKSQHQEIARKAAAARWGKTQ